MAITIKTADEIEKMRVAGRLAAEVLDMITPYVEPGVTTESLNQRCHDYIVNTQKAIPAPLNYKGFPKSICTSVNAVVCHGIPNNKPLKNGDIINIDVTVIKEGYHGDTSKMFLVGDTSTLAKRLVKATQEAMYLGIQQVKPGGDIIDIGAAIQKYITPYDYSIVKEYCGHGIGSVFHEEEASVLHYRQSKPQQTMEPGMIFTIEPMINAGKRHVKLKKDNWTVVTKDRQLSAQWEHTILVTDTGYDVLTLRDEETFPRTG